MMRIVRHLGVAALVALGGVGIAQAGGKPKALPPPACDVRRKGGCFDLIVDGQKALPLATGSGTAVYHGVDYHTHTREEVMWHVPDPVSNQPAFAFRPNPSSAAWFGGNACLDVIIEVANPSTYHAERVAHFGCNGPANARADGGDVATAPDAIAPPTALAPGDYVVFVRAYGPVKGWDGKTLFVTVGK